MSALGLLALDYTTCANCVWWHPHDETGEQGACRRREPRLVLSRQSDTRSAVWPPTKPGDWCGEFRSAPAKASQPEEKADV